MSFNSSSYLHLPADSNSNSNAIINNIENNINKTIEQYPIEIDNNNNNNNNNKISLDHNKNLFDNNTHNKLDNINQNIELIIEESKVSLNETRLILNRINSQYQDFYNNQAKNSNKSEFCDDLDSSSSKQLQYRQQLINSSITNLNHLFGNDIEICATETGNYYSNVH